MERSARICGEHFSSSFGCRCSSSSSVSSSDERAQPGWSEVSGKRSPAGQAWQGWWSATHCWSWSCCLWGFLHLQPAQLGTEGLVWCSQSVWAERWKRTRMKRITKRKEFPEERCCLQVTPGVSGHTRGGVSPSLCADRKSRSNALCYSRCTSRSPCGRSSSSSVITKERSALAKNIS